MPERDLCPVCHTPACGEPEYDPNVDLGEPLGFDLGDLQILYLGEDPGFLFDGDA